MTAPLVGLFVTRIECDFFWRNISAIEFAKKAVGISLGGEERKNVAEKTLLRMINFASTKRRVFTVQSESNGISSLWLILRVRNQQSEYKRMFWGLLLEPFPFLTRWMRKNQEKTIRIWINLEFFIIFFILKSLCKQVDVQVQKLRNNNDSCTSSSASSPKYQELDKVTVMSGLHFCSRCSVSAEHCLVYLLHKCVCPRPVCVIDRFFGWVSRQGRCAAAQNVRRRRFNPFSLPFVRTARLPALNGPFPEVVPLPEQSCLKSRHSRPVVCAANTLYHATRESAVNFTWKGLCSYANRAKVW